MIGVINYGVGNLGSIMNMLKRVGLEAQLAETPEAVLACDRLILPGVGHFDHCAREFRNSGLVETIEKKVFDHRTPILGVCVGCQMLLESSEEGEEAGLGWLPGRVVRFQPDKLPAGYKIPHMGWSEVEVKAGSVLYKDMEEPRFYFVHSYHLDCKTPEAVSATADYGYRFTASVQKDTIYGVQFHPEKSHRFGMQLLANFARISA